MSVAVAEKLHVIHTLAGRVRVHLPGWSGQGRRSIEAQLREVPGVWSVQANPLTGNVLIQFDPAITQEQTILAVLRSLEPDTTGTPDDEPPLPPAIRERQGRIIRARIAVRGLDRDPQLAKRVVDHLKRRPGVHAEVSQLTGRVLVEFTEHKANLEDLIAEVVDLELPELPGETRPAYPLDPGPLIQSVIRLSGATLGLGLLTTRRLLHVREPLPGARTALQIASILAILQSIPPIRYGLRKLLGQTVSSLLFNVPSIITFTLAGSQLGLVVNGLEALRLLTEEIARRSAWRRYEERVEHAAPAQPDAVIHLESGERTPLAAKVIEGTGTASGPDGMPLPVTPGSTIPPGARLYGGPFVLKLQAGESFQAFIPMPRPSPPTPSIFERYLQAMGPVSLAYTGVTALLTRSLSRTLAALLLVTPRTAMIGAENAELGAVARMIRAGVIIAGTRTNRSYRRPDAVFLDGVRLLTDGLELSGAWSMTNDYDTAEILAIAASAAAAAGSPWGGAFRAANGVTMSSGTFDSKVATASVDGVQYSLGPVEDWSAIPEAARLRQRGNYVLVLRSDREEQPLGVFALRPQLASGVSDLVEACQRYGVELRVISSGDQIAVQAVARRAHVSLLESNDAVEAIRAKQKEGALVAFVSDNAGAAPGFAACDLAIGVTDGSSRLPVQADLLAPDLTAVAAILEATVCRGATVRDSVGLAVVSNIIGGVWDFRGRPGLRHAGRAVSIASLIAIADGWLRLMGGERQRSTIFHLFDPHPERWGQRSVEQVLHVLNSSPEGLSSAQAAERLHKVPPEARRNSLLMAFLEQINSPLIAIYAAGAGLSLFTGAVGDFVIIGATILANITLGVWQEHKANQVAAALATLSTSTARVLRDGRSVTIPASEVVPGDVLLLAPGDRIAADARLLSSHGLEVDEAALTGESVPVSKAPIGGTDASRTVMEGSDVTTGTGHAVVVAVGRQTRMGATAAALSTGEMEQSPLGVRLNRMLRVLLPLSIGGGGIILASGFLRRIPLASLLTIGMTTILAAIPEGLPLLASVGEAGVARRLGDQDAVVRRLSAVEALGRVDVACTDKTGTLTKGQLALSMVADYDQEARVPGELSTDLRHVLVTAALASPHPSAQDAKAHPTDVAIIQGAVDAGLGQQLHVKHEAELSFDPVRSFHVTVAQGYLCVKGAPEALIPRCNWMLKHGEKRPLGENGQHEWLDLSRRLAERGLRVLMVAEGSPDTPLDNPRGLTALGFVGISDPLRPDVQAAVHRCREAGVRVIMITGDHPATARTIAQEAGLLDKDGEVLTGAEVLELQNSELDERLERAVVIARTTPLDKLRIIEGLQRRGHTVAMTGDGVNDAPALRLADVGVAMGRAGTEVARQVADVVLVDDDFSTLVEALIEGRSYWRNIRRALGLLLGGNLGELGLVVGASLVGLNFPLTARQILSMNVITDLLPATAVALQQPEHHSLAGLDREGAAALGTPLRNEIFRRAITSAGPALVSYLIMLVSSTLPEARTVAYASIVATQLAQTLDAGRSAGGLTRSVFAAVAGSTAVLLATLTMPPLRDFLTLVTPSPFGWALIGAGALIAVVMSRVLAVASPVRSAFTLPSASSITQLAPVQS
jgi:cation-transporting P-type ATPase I